MRWTKNLSVLLAILALAWSCGDDGGGPVAPDPPTISPLNVGSVRAGEVLVITGTNLSGALALPAGALALAQNAVEVLVDGRVLTPESVTATEIRVRIPLDLEPGSHTLTVRVNGRTSNAITFQVEVFTVTGVYEGTRRIASATCNDPIAEAELRQIFPVGQTGNGSMLAVDQRPALSLVAEDQLTGEVLEATGTLNADGTFEAVIESDDPEVTSDITGSFTTTGDDVRAEFVNTVRLDTLLDNGFQLICEVQLEFAVARVSTDVSAAPADRGWSAGGSSSVHPIRRAFMGR